MSRVHDHLTAAASASADIRNSGIELIGGVPWGTHFCQFYQTKQDLLAVLVPFIKSGLENNEFCMWVTADILQKHEAEQALREAVEDFDDYVRRGAMVILPYTEWYLDGGVFDRHRVLDSWIVRLNEALAAGFAGARVTGDTMWLESAHWQDFKEYEASINTVIHGVPLLVLCTYCLGKCGASEVADVVSNHEFALMKREGEWTIIESAEFKQTREALLLSERRYQGLFASMSEGFAFHEIICDDDARPVDYRFLEVNPAFEVLTGLRATELIGRTVMEVLPDTEPIWIERYGHVALTGESVSFQQYSSVIDKHFEVRAYSPAPMRFACVFSDITERVEHERQREEVYRREHHIAEMLQKALVPSVECRIPGCQIDVEYHPVLTESEVGGDFYDVFSIDGGKYGILIGDVAGKGLLAAMRVAAVRHTIRGYALLDPRPARVLTLANEALSRDGSDGHWMITAFFGVYDTATRVLTYSNSGQEPPFFRGADGAVSELLLPGVPLGVLNDSIYSETELPMADGDTLVVLTDGVTEARRGSRVFGAEGVRRCVGAFGAGSGADLASALVNAAVAHAGGHLQDDVAVLVLKVTDES